MNGNRSRQETRLHATDLEHAFFAYNDFYDTIFISYGWALNGGNEAMQWPESFDMANV